MAPLEFFKGDTVSVTVVLIFLVPTVIDKCVLRILTDVLMGFCSLQLQLWDTAGEERFRQNGLTSSYYRGAHGALVVFSLTSCKSFQSVKNLWLEEFYRKR